MTYPSSPNWQRRWKELEAKQGNIGLDYVINPVLYPGIAALLRTQEQTSIVDFGAGTNALAREVLLADPATVPALNAIADFNALRKRITAVTGLEGDLMLVERGETLMKQDIHHPSIHLQHHVVQEGVFSPFADESVEIVTSRQFFMHLSTPDLIHHLADANRILKPGGSYLCSILNPEYEQRKQRELNPDTSSLIAHEPYVFAHGATGEYGSIPQYWRSLEDYQTLFEQSFDQVMSVACSPITDRFQGSHPRYYQQDCPMAFVFILKKKDPSMTLGELKKRSQATGFASILGKSTIAKESDEYGFMVEATCHLLEQGFGVIHGGYAGGAMSAASDTACAYIAKHRLAPERNIGIPQRQHDGLWERVPGAVFTDASDDIYDRLRLVTGGDIAMVAPLGGDGTELEVATLHHENIIRSTQAETCRGAKPTPMIFLQTATGTDWKKILAMKMDLLATSIKTLEQCPWILFASSMEEFKERLVQARKMI